MLTTEGGDIDHTHECVDCGKVKTFPTEEMPEAMYDVLSRMMEPGISEVAQTEIDPPTWVH